VDGNLKRLLLVLSLGPTVHQRELLQPPVIPEEPPDARLPRGVSSSGWRTRPAGSSWCERATDANLSWLLKNIVCSSSSSSSSSWPTQHMPLLLLLLLWWQP
jgi:hypothetical protein